MENQATVSNKRAISGGYVWRAILSIVVGLILVIWPSFTATYIITIIGAMLLLTGIILMIAFYSTGKKKDETAEKHKMGLSFPIGGLVCVVLGILLITMPMTFAKILIVVMGVLLILGSLDQIWILAAASRKKGVKVGVVYYIVPVLTLIVGIILAISPQRSLHLMLIVFGVTAIVYGLNDLVDQYLVRKPKAA